MLWLLMQDMGIIINMSQAVFPYKFRASTKNKNT